MQGDRSEEKVIDFFAGCYQGIDKRNGKFRCVLIELLKISKNTLVQIVRSNLWIAIISFVQPV